jgi:hypothetical protein
MQQRGAAYVVVVAREAFLVLGIDRLRMLLEQLRKDFVSGRARWDMESELHCDVNEERRREKTKDEGNVLSRQPRPMLKLSLGHAQHASVGFDVSLELRHRVADAVGAKVQLAQLRAQHICCPKRV